MEYDDMARNIGELQNSAQHAVELERQTRDMTRLLDEAMKQITLLEENLQATEQEKNETISKLLQSNMETFRLQNILHAAVKSVKEALKVKYWLLNFNSSDVMKSTNLYVLSFCVGRLLS